MTRHSLTVRLPLAIAVRRTALSAVAALLFGFAQVGGSGRAWAESAPEFRVIVNPDNPTTSLEREFLSDVYLKRVTRWNDGETVRPVDQRADSSVRRKFCDSILKRSVAAVKRYWQQRIFAGRDLPPPELDADDAVVAYVLKYRGAVGYVSGAAKLDRTKPVVVH